MAVLPEQVETNGTVGAYTDDVGDAALLRTINYVMSTLPPKCTVCETRPAIGQDNFNRSACAACIAGTIGTIVGHVTLGPRNGKCPCGSGKKVKKCAVNHAPAKEKTNADAVVS